MRINIKNNSLIMMFMALLCFGRAVGAEEARRDPAAGENFSLSVLIEEALLNNPEVLAAEKRWEAAKARVPQRRSPEDPVVGMQFMRIPRGTMKLEKTMPDDRILSVSQMFPFFGKLSLKGKIAFAESLMVAAAYRDKQLEIINEVEKSYYELFMNDRERDLSRQNLQFLESMAKISEANYATGRIRQEEVLKIHLEIGKFANRLANLEQERLSQQARLNILLNREADAPAGVPEVIENTDFNWEVKELYEFTLQNQPELAMFAYALERNQHAEKLAKRNIFPDLMVEMGLRGVTSGGLGPWDLMMGMSVPLWYWTKQRYEIKEAIANVEEAQAAYGAVKNKVLFETRDMLARVETAKNTAKLYKNDLVPLIEQALDSSLSSFRSGENNAMMVLDTQRMFVEYKMKYYQAQVDYHKSVSDLQRAVGTLLSEVDHEEE